MDDYGHGEIGQFRSRREPNLAFLFNLRFRANILQFISNHHLSPLGVSRRLECLPIHLQFHVSAHHSV
jgi:hypothetical protein